MKTPDEIKRGLECCSDATYRCAICPYDTYDCDGELVVADALAYVQQLEAAQPRWISVEERLPEDGVDVIVHTDRCGGNVEYAYYRHKRNTWFKNYSVLRYDITHWMPFPEPPKEGEYEREHGKG